MRMIKRVFVVHACLYLLGLSSFAQKDGTGQDIIAPVQAETAKSADDRDLLQLIERVMTLHLSKAVVLSDAQLERLVERHGSFKDRLQKMKFERVRARTHLCECLDLALPEAEIQRELEALLAKEVAIVELQQELIEEAGKDLTTPQTARLYLFMREFESFMRDQIRRAKYISLHGGPPEVVPEAPARSRTNEEGLIEELVRRESGGPLDNEAADAGMVDLFDGLLMAMLAQALELSPEEAVVFFRRIGTYKDQLHELKWQIGDAQTDLRNSLEAGEPDAVIERKLGDLLLQEKAVAELIHRLVTEARKDVSLAKSARLYLFVGDFEEYVLRLLDRAAQISAGYQAYQLESQP